MMDPDSESRKGNWINPLPLIMIALLAGGVLVKNIPLESSRPTAPERIKFVPTGQQNVQARLWQDPFAAVEAYEAETQLSRSPPSGEPESPDESNVLSPLARGKLHEATVLAVSISGDSYAESAENRRRYRYAVIAALGFHGFYPEVPNAIGYFHIPQHPSVQHLTSGNTLTVPFEWFNKKESSEKILLLWLNESLYEPELINILQSESGKLTLIGPAGSSMLLKLSGSRINEQIRIFSPTATINNCDLSKEAASQKTSISIHSVPSWRCFASNRRYLAGGHIVRTIGTDDVLSVSLLWELWQRGINREQHWTQSNNQTAPCKDGLVLISEWDSTYSRTLADNLSEGFSTLCPKSENRSPPIRNFTYLRGIDGIGPGKGDTSQNKATRQSETGKTTDLLSQLDTAAPELAEGMSQYDYLRRLIDEIIQLDQDSQFAQNGVRAIGIVGSDVYDKLLILQALRHRLKGKIFFTTDLDARFLHADQKDWTRNLIIASNFGLTLHPSLQKTALPFRDGYQTATYLATVMALTRPPQECQEKSRKEWGQLAGNMGIPLTVPSLPENCREGELRQELLQLARDKGINLTIPASPQDWNELLQQWLEPKIYEIGRTTAVTIASPSIDDLIGWIDGTQPDGISRTAKPAPCSDWITCQRIEPYNPLITTPVSRYWLLLPVVLLLSAWIILSSPPIQRKIRVLAYRSRTSVKSEEIRTVSLWILVLSTIIVGIVAITGNALQTALEQGTGEPFIWLEGISAWPNLTIRFIGFITILALMLIFTITLRGQVNVINERFYLTAPSSRSLERSRLSALWNGPNLDLTVFDAGGRFSQSAAPIEISTLWQNYLRATSWREKCGWMIASAMIVLLLSSIMFSVLDIPSFPHRGELIRYLHYILLGITAPLFWLIIFWIGYENRVCAQLIEALGKAHKRWPESLLERASHETGIPEAYLDPYLTFQLTVAATERIQALIYLPFIAIFFTVVARSDLFDVMDFPLSLVLIIIAALLYTLYTAKLLRRSAENLRAEILAQYDLVCLRLAQPGNPSHKPLSSPCPGREQVTHLTNEIRTTRKGAFASLSYRPTFLASLLPFGGFGGAQLIEYLFTF